MNKTVIVNIRNEISIMDENLQNAIVAAVTNNTVPRVEMPGNSKLVASPEGPENLAIIIEIGYLEGHDTETLYLAASGRNDLDQINSENDGRYIKATFGNVDQNTYCSKKTLNMSTVVTASESKDVLFFARFLCRASFRNEVITIEKLQMFQIFNEEFFFINFTCRDFSCCY